MEETHVSQWNQAPAGGGAVAVRHDLPVLAFSHSGRRIKLDSPGPVFFKQKRVGIGKKHFYILKFRTMRIDTPHDMPTHLLHDPGPVYHPHGSLPAQDQSGRAAPAVEYLCR